MQLSLKKNRKMNMVLFLSYYCASPPYALNTEEMKLSEVRVPGWSFPWNLHISKFVKLGKFLEFQYILFICRMHTFVPFYML